MLQFNDLSEERKKEIHEYIRKNSSENSFKIAKRFNITVARTNKIKRKYKSYEL